jgi:hypothetical protein
MLSPLVLTGAIVATLVAAYIRRTARPGTPTYIQPASCDFEPSLWRDNTEIENW